MAENPTVWGKHKLRKTGMIYKRIGKLNLWFCMTEDEFQVYYNYSEEENSQPPENTNWQRWSMQKGLKEIELSPALSPIPIIIYPQNPFRMMPKINTTIYVRVPLWVQILVKGDLILEIPSMELSKTWFGDFFSGEMGLSIFSAARKAPKLESETPFLAITPINIYNRSNDELVVEKICHRVNHLSLYSKNNNLWTNETRVHYKGDNQISEVGYQQKAPKAAGAATRIALPRDHETRSITGKTFDTLRELAELKFLHR